MKKKTSQEGVQSPPPSGRPKQASSSPGKQPWKSLWAFGPLALPLLILFSLLVEGSWQALGGSSTSIAMALPLTMIAEGLLLLLGSLLTWPRGRRLEGLGLHWPGVKALTMGLLAGGGVFILIQLLNALVASLGVNLSDSHTSTGLEDLQGTSRILFLYVATPLLVPLLEELIFRGLCFGATQDLVLAKGKSKKYALTTAVVVNSLWFALAHAQGTATANDLLVPLWILLVALVNSFLRWKYSSVVVAVASHMTYNLATVGVLLLLRTAS